MPEIEEREAAIFNGYTWKEWTEAFDLLTPEGRYNRAANIAAYRLHDLIQMHVDDAINSEISKST